MLTIRETQFETFSESERATFLERLHKFLASNLHRDVTSEEVNVLVQRGEQYGLVTEQDFARYSFIAARFNSAASQNDPPWIKNVMFDRGEPAALRLKQLFSDAEQHLQALR